MTRHYITVFAIKSQPSELTAVWKIKRKLPIEKKEIASESYSWKIAVFWKKQPLHKAAARRCSWKYVFLKSLQYSQENTHVGDFLK